MDLRALSQRVGDMLAQIIDTPTGQCRNRNDVIATTRLGKERLSFGLGQQVDLVPRLDPGRALPFPDAQ